jgi:hypothetical protein
MEWRVTLSGEDSDLEELSKSFHSDNLKIWKDKDNYILSSSDFNGIAEAKIILKKSEEILAFINAGSKTIQDLQKPIDVSGVESLDENDRSTQHIFPESIPLVSKMGRSTVLIDGKVEETRIYEELPNFVLLAMQDRNVAAVLNYLNTGSTEIATLYKIYEIIRTNVGGDKSMRDNGWASMSQFKSFRTTANSPSAMGYKARHGVWSEQKLKNPMSLSEAESLILHLVKCWLNSKITD